MTSTEPLTYSIEEAAERLGHVVTPDWLRKRIKHLPHRKSGPGVGRSGRVGFSEDDLTSILESLAVKPETAPVAADDVPVGRRRPA